MSEEEKAVRDEKGRWLPGYMPPNAITAETSRGLLERRALKRQLRAEAASRGVIKAAAEFTGRLIATDEEAHEIIAQELVQGGLANALDHPRDAWAGISGGLRLADQLPADTQQQPQGAAVTLMVSAEGLAWLERLVAGAAGQIIEGEGRDITS